MPALPIVVLVLATFLKVIKHEPLSASRTVSERHETVNRELKEVVLVALRRLDPPLGIGDCGLLALNIVVDGGEPVVETKIA